MKQPPCTIGEVADSGRMASPSALHRSDLPRDGACVPETLVDILAVHRAGQVTPEQTVERCYARIKAHADPAVFITLRDEAALRHPSGGQGQY
jgi:hypothetical protein